MLQRITCISCKNKNTLERPFFTQLGMKTNVVCCMGSLFQIQQPDFNATFLGHLSTQLALRVLTSPASQQSTMRRARASQRARSSQSRITSATPGACSCLAASALFPVQEYIWITSATPGARSCLATYGCIWKDKQCVCANSGTYAKSKSVTFA